MEYTHNEELSIYLKNLSSNQITVTYRTFITRNKTLDDFKHSQKSNYNNIITIININYKYVHLYTKKQSEFLPLSPHVYLFAGMS